MKSHVEQVAASSCCRSDPSVTSSTRGLTFLSQSRELSGLNHPSICSSSLVSCQQLHNFREGALVTRCANRKDVHKLRPWGIRDDFETILSRVADVGFYVPVFLEICWVDSRTCSSLCSVVTGHKLSVRLHGSRMWNCPQIEMAYEDVNSSYANTKMSMKQERNVRSRLKKTNPKRPLETLLLLQLEAILLPPVCWVTVQ